LLKIPGSFDFEIKFGTTIFQLHKSIIRVRCHKLLDCGINISEQFQISENIFKVFLEFIYGNKFEISSFDISDIISLLNFSQFMEVNDLITLCQRAFGSTLSKENICKAIILCKKYEMIEQFNWCSWFFGKQKNSTFY